MVLCEPEDPEVQLTLEPDSWVHKWANTQAGGEVCQYKLWMAGPPGPVRLIVRCGLTSSRDLPCWLDPVEQSHQISQPGSSVTHPGLDGTMTASACFLVSRRAYEIVATMAWPTWRARSIVGAIPPDWNP